MEARPFLKWAGGKTQLLSTLLANAPAQFNDYYEPFLGGGAFFFRLASLGKIKNSHLNDINKDLITAYRAVKERPEELIEALSSKKYKNDEATYYKIRAQEPASDIDVAARLIYLNKTAFNGLYRVNSKGKFNVPYGKYANPKIPDVKNLLAVNVVLQTDELTSLDFEAAVEGAKKGDFIYFDPPYVPVSKTSSFTGYTKESFGAADQQRLFGCFKKLDKKGCLVMLSNSYMETTSEMYKEFNITSVRASRVINCNPEGRGKVNELIITNYQIPSLLRQKAFLYHHSSSR